MLDSLNKEKSEKGQVVLDLSSLELRVLADEILYPTPIVEGNID